MQALRGEELCRHHSIKANRDRQAAKADSITVSSLSSLVSLDVTDGDKLKQLRRGLLAHVGRGTLGVQEARAMHELAQAIHDSARADKPPTAMSTLTAALRRAMKSEATPTGEGGDSQPGDDGKDVKARIATDPK
jgi:hypothetical protein